MNNLFKFFGMLLGYVFFCVVGLVLGQLFLNSVYMLFVDDGLSVNSCSTYARPISPVYLIFLLIFVCFLSGYIVLLLFDFDFGDVGGWLYDLYLGLVIWFFFMPIVFI